MDASAQLKAQLKTCPVAIGKVVDFNPFHDRLYHFDFTAANAELDAAAFADTAEFSRWVNKKLITNNCRYGVGGYMENRVIYERSRLFDSGEEPRRLHLGADIWAAAGTPVYSPLPGTVHSFNDNDNFGDYGPTIILKHELNGLEIYSLFGHLSRQSLDGLKVGQPVAINQNIGAFGAMDENGHWPPHLHFQLMLDMEGRQGDYPGVCRLSEKAKYLKNIPDPQLILHFPIAVIDEV